MLCNGRAFLQHTHCISFFFFTKQPNAACCCFPCSTLEADEEVAMPVLYSWRDLSAEVVSKILWSENLQLADRLRCESVCKSWQELLRHLPDATANTQAVRDLCIELQCSSDREHLSSAKWVNGEPPCVTVWETTYGQGAELNKSLSSCLDWLVLKLHLLRKIQLTAVYPPFWSMIHLLDTVKDTSLRLSPLLEVKLKSDYDRLLSYQEDLPSTALVDLELAYRKGQLAVMQHVNTMTNLTSLRLTYGSRPFQAGDFLPQLQDLCRLHTLELRHFREPQLQQGLFSTLRRLVLQDCYLTICDVSSHTQLTSLDIVREGGGTLQLVILPVGNSVNLQSLTLDAVPDTDFYSLHNLHVATQLTYLNLTDFQEPRLQLDSLQQLQDLTLDSCSMTTYDLSSATQLTRVYINWSESMSKEVRLPTGSSVQLQHLTISAFGRPHSFRTLHDLADAAQITYLKFYDTYPTNICQMGWPALMPDLQVFKANWIPLASLQQLVGYTNLRQLELGCHMVTRATTEFHSLPQWSSQLTRLTKLEDLSIQANLRQFPTVMLELKQLRSLDLSSNEFDMAGLPADIMRFTTFTALTSLDIRLSVHSGSTWASSRHAASQEARDRLSVLARLLGPGVLRC